MSKTKGKETKRLSPPQLRQALKQRANEAYNRIEQTPYQRQVKATKPTDRPLTLKDFETINRRYQLINISNQTNSTI
jgi:hypothetical protein